MNSKIINLHLADGVPSGIIIGSITNWTGEVVIAPFFEFETIGPHTDIKRPGVYFLIGADPNDEKRQCIYIGESENVWARLGQHVKDENKAFFERVVIVVSVNDQLNKGHVLYLESRLIEITKSAQNLRVWNDTAPDVARLSNAERVTVEYFLEQIQVLLPTLGFNFVLPSSSNKAMQPTYTLRYNGANASAEIINGQFVVLKGSMALTRVTNSLSQSYLKLRNHLLETRRLDVSEKLDFLRFAENVAFSSPSAAAAVIAGTPVNGRKYWIHVSGMSYGDLQEKRLNDTLG